MKVMSHRFSLKSNIMPQDNVEFSGVGFSLSSREEFISSPITKDPLSPLSMFKSFVLHAFQTMVEYIFYCYKESIQLANE